MAAGTSANHLLFVSLTAGVSMGPFKMIKELLKRNPPGS